MTDLLTELEALIEKASQHLYRADRTVDIDGLRALIAAEKARGPDPALEHVRTETITSPEIKFCHECGTPLGIVGDCLPPSPDPLPVQAREALAVCEAEREDLRRKLADTEASRDSWMNDFSMLATRVDKLVSILVITEAERDALCKELADYREYYELRALPLPGILEKRWLIMERIEARKNAALAGKEAHGE